MSAIEARVRGSSRDELNAGSDSSLRMSKGGELYIAQALPSKAEAVRLGNYWTTTIPTGSAFTNVANMPTTRAELILYNGNVNGGASLIIDQISFLSLTSVTAAAGVAIVWQVNNSTVTDDTTVLINGATGLTYGGRAQRDLALTTMVANKWTIANTSPTGAAASIGLSVVAEINGGIIVKPGFALGVNAVVGTAVGTSLMGISWIEAEL